MSSKTRDVEVAYLDHGLCIVAACDSCGAIGSKELDQVPVPPYITGRFTARVALLEVLASGARPEIITVAISNELDPTGSEILKGVRDELAAAGLETIKLVSSTEKNVTTRQTGLGISVVGSCYVHDLRLGKTRPGDLIYGLGLPKVGNEVGDPDDPEIIQARHLWSMLDTKEIHDFIPIGSRGIAHECLLLEQELQRKIMFEPNCPIPIAKSAGPSTVMIFTTPTEIELSGSDLPPLYMVGRIVRD